MESNTMTQFKEDAASQSSTPQSLSPDSREQEVHRQMRIILQGVSQVISEEELAVKIRRSLDTGIPLTVKLGLDPSAPDIHLGHAVVLRKIRQLQSLGHRAVIIIGDFTGRIGDPTGKSKGRRALSDREILINSQTYQEQIFRILDPEKTTVFYNGEWLEMLTLEEVLRLASTVTVARMLERDDFQNRFNNRTPIGLHEFFYPLMQAYDSVAVKADIELGGTDQTFNILMGRSLQKEQGQEPQTALFMPILEGLDGIEKMSKSLGNYIGVNEEAGVMFKKVMEIPDRLIVKYFELATDILPQELDQIREKLADGCNPRDCKLLLARTITALYHTTEETAAAETFYHQAFTNKGLPEQVPAFQAVAEAGVLQDIIRQLAEAGMVKSGSDFRRLLSQGGIQLNQQKISDPQTPIRSGDILRIGKKKFIRLELL